MVLASQQRDLKQTNLSKPQCPHLQNSGNSLYLPEFTVTINVLTGNLWHITQVTITYMINSTKNEFVLTHIAFVSPNFPP